MFANHYSMKLEINYRNKIGKIRKYVEIKQYIPKQPMSQRRNQKGNFKKNLKNGKPYTKLMGCCKSNSKIKFIVIKAVGEEKRKISNKQSKPQGARSPKSW